MFEKDRENQLSRSLAYEASSVSIPQTMLATDVKIRSVFDSVVQTPDSQPSIVNPFCLLVP